MEELASPGSMVALLPLPSSHGTKTFMWLHLRCIAWLPRM